MRRRWLLWQFYPAYLVITAVALIAVGWFATDAVETWYLDSLRTSLEERARLIAAEISDPALPPAEVQRLRPICSRISEATGSRITLIFPDGNVACDTAELPGKMDNHKDRPEVRQALEGKIGRSTRMSTTLQQRLSYVALPVIRDNRLVAVARASVPIAPVNEVIRSLQWKIATVSIGVAIVAGIASLFFARRVSQPVEEMLRAAERFARGEWQYKLPLPESEELAGLAAALNVMGQEVDERIRAVAQQQSEQQAVLSSMVEGVLAVDAGRRVLSLNQAAAQLLGGPPEQLAGHMLGEVVRQTELLDFVDRSLTADQPITAELTMWGEPERTVQARGASLRDAQGASLGAVIVLHDVTHFRRLENVRRDFVANVSHELKTPVASIKGFVETLLDGALNNPEEAERFLLIIAKQADRLHALVEDLLSLSRIEQAEETGGVQLEVGPVKPMLDEAVAACQPLAAERNIRIVVRCPDELQANMHAPLMEQAVSNLVDNAIKYSNQDGEVIVEASLQDSELAISVSDRGCGIAAEHLPRIFERFYRVDKSRSRKPGGTGLGLSIVKHVLNAHRGRISVDSTLGEGSTFTIYLPRA